ncbi:methyltransferase [Vibrio splendidus]
MQKLQKNSSKNKRFTRIMSIASWILDIPNKLTPAPFRVMQIGSLFWQSRALYIIVKLGVADEISTTPTSTYDLADKLSLHEPYLYRLMRFMASIGIFKEKSHRQFIHTRLSLSLQRENKENVCDMVLMHNSPQMTLPWMEAMEESIKSGSTPFEQCYGSEMFTYMDSNKELNDLFSNAMDNVEAITGLEYLSDFNWGAFDRIIDLGGSKGSKSISILTEYPKLSAIVFDRYNVIKYAKGNWEGKIEKQVLDRISFVGGDLFSSPIPVVESSRELYLLIGIFHLLDDALAITLLTRICEAMGDCSARIAIVDAVLSETEVSFTEASFDIQMMMGTKGEERTLAQWEYIFDCAKVEVVEIVSIRTFAKVLVLKKVEEV